MALTKGLIINAPISVEVRLRELELNTLILEDTKKALIQTLDALEIERAKFARDNARDEAILSSIGDGLVVTDYDMKVLRINHAGEEMLGWKEEELLRREWYQVVKMLDEHGQELPLSETPFGRALAAGKATTTTTTQFVRKDGTIFPVTLSASPVKVGSDLLGAVVVFRDITKEKEIDRMKTDFVSITSHQLRTPLTGIQWLTELLEKEKLTGKGQEYLNDIKTSTQRLNKLVELLLNVSRIEEGKIAISPQSIDVVNFIKKVVDSLAILNSKKGLSFTFTADEPKIIATTDVGALQNIAQAILSNAVEYTPEGGKIEVSIKKQPARHASAGVAGGGRMFLLTVSDTGIGIPKEDHGRIFQEFARASNAGRVKAAGMGLGLWIAKQATELLGGKIWFESEENKGTTFFIELPMKSKSIKGTKQLV